MRSPTEKRRSHVKRIHLQTVWGRKEEVIQRLTSIRGRRQRKVSFKILADCGITGAEIKSGTPLRKGGKREES